MENTTELDKLVIKENNRLYEKVYSKISGDDRPLEYVVLSVEDCEHLSSDIYKNIGTQIANRGAKYGIVNMNGVLQFAFDITLRRVTLVSSELVIVAKNTPRLMVNHIKEAEDSTAMLTAITSYCLVKLHKRNIYNVRSMRFYMEWLPEGEDRKGAVYSIMSYYNSKNLDAILFDMEKYYGLTIDTIPPGTKFTKDTLSSTDFDMLGDILSLDADYEYRYGIFKRILLNKGIMLVRSSHVNDNIVAMLFYTETDGSRTISDYIPNERYIVKDLATMNMAKGIIDAIITVVIINSIQCNIELKIDDTTGWCNHSSAIQSDLSNACSITILHYIAEIKISGYDYKKVGEAICGI